MTVLTVCRHHSWLWNTQRFILKRSNDSLLRYIEQSDSMTCRSKSTADLKVHERNVAVVQFVKRKWKIIIRLIWSALRAYRYHSPCLYSILFLHLTLKQTKLCTQLLTKQISRRSKSLKRGLNKHLKLHENVQNICTKSICNTDFMFKGLFNEVINLLSYLIDSIQAVRVLQCEPKLI